MMKKKLCLDGEFNIDDLRKIIEIIESKKVLYHAFCRASAKSVNGNFIEFPKFIESDYELKTIEDFDNLGEEISKKSSEFYNIDLGKIYFINISKLT